MSTHRPPYLLWLGMLAAAIAFGSLGWLSGQRALMPAEKPPPTGLMVVEIGQPLPAIALPDLHTGAVRQLGTPGRAQLINYWASWCGPCREEMPALDAYAREQGNNGVEVIGIALDTAEDARAFLAEVPVSFTLLIEPASARDSSVQLGNARGVLPYTVLIDAQGRLSKRHYGAFPDAAAIADWVDSRD